MGNITFNEAFGRTLTGHPSVPLLLKVASVAAEMKKQQNETLKKQAGLGQALGAGVLGGMGGAAYGATQGDTGRGARIGAGAGAGTVVGKDITDWALNQIGVMGQGLHRKPISHPLLTTKALVTGKVPYKAAPQWLRIPLMVLGAAFGGITGGAVMASTGKKQPAPKKA